MEGNATPKHPHRRWRSLIVSGVVAVAGLALTATAAFGWHDCWCHVARDCVYGHAPETHIEGGPANVTDDPTPTFHFDSTDPYANFKCRLDGRPYHSCQNPYTTPHLPDGSHSIDARAVNRKGAFDPSAASRDFKVAASKGHSGHVHGSGHRSSHGHNAAHHSSHGHRHGGRSHVHHHSHGHHGGHGHNGHGHQH